MQEKLLHFDSANQAVEFTRFRWWQHQKTNGAPSLSSVKPNPSFEARPNGKPPSPAPGVVYHPSAGLGALPSVPPQLER